MLKRLIVCCHSERGEESLIISRRSFAQADSQRCFAQLNMTEENAASVLHVNCSNNPPIMPDSHGAQADVQISKANPEEAQPGPEHVPTIEATDAGICAITRARCCQLIAKSADQMSQ